MAWQKVPDLWKCNQKSPSLRWARARIACQQPLKRTATAHTGSCAHAGAAKTALSFRPMCTSVHHGCLGPGVQFNGPKGRGVRAGSRFRVSGAAARAALAGRSPRAAASALRDGAARPGALPRHEVQADSGRIDCIADGSRRTPHEGAVGPRVGRVAGSPGSRGAKK